MRTINYIVVHCTATPQNTSVQSILNYWKNALSWKRPGYHYIIEANGNIVNLQPIEQLSNGVAGFNTEIINISYIGGVDKNNKPIDNRTPKQKQSLLKKLRELKKMFPEAKIQGHRDFPNVAKACPSFDAKTEYKDLK